MRHILRGALGAGLIAALPVQAASVFINEFHYDNAGADQGEAIELAGPVGTDLSGWRLALYNGGNGASYGSIALSGIIPEQQAGLGTLAFAADGLQNGAPDGLALVDPISQIPRHRGFYSLTISKMTILAKTFVMPGLTRHPGKRPTRCRL